MTPGSQQAPTPDVLDDLLPDGAPADQRAIGAPRAKIRHRRADCDLLAATVSAVTGWPIVAVSSPAGPLHRLVRMSGGSGGQMADITGLVSEADLRQRFGRADLTIIPGSAPAQEGSHDHLAVAHTLTRLDYPPFNTLDFQRRLLAFCATLAADPRDLPAPVSFAQLEHAAETNDVVTVNQFLAQALAAPAEGEAAEALETWVAYCVQRAIERNHPDVVKAFLDATDVPAKLDTDRCNWLHVGISFNVTAIVRVLLEHPRCAHLVNLPSSGSGMMPLQSCLSTNWRDDTGATRLDMAKLFLANGASPWLFNEYGTAAIHWAVAAGEISFVRTLVEQGVPVDHTGPDNGVPPVFLAVELGNTHMVDALRELGANTAAHSRSGRTLLTHCIVSADERADHMFLNGNQLGMPSADPQMIQHLIEVVGLDPDQDDLNGDTAYAMAAGMPQVGQVLDAFRARRAMAGALATVSQQATQGGRPSNGQP